MANETKNPTDPVRTFRVLHGAVSGIGKNRKGETVEHDFYTGAVVTDAQLENNSAYYISMGAIVEITEGVGNEPEPPVE